MSPSPVSCIGALNTLIVIVTVIVIVIVAHVFMHFGPQNLTFFASVVPYKAHVMPNKYFYSSFIGRVLF